MIMELFLPLVTLLIILSVSALGYSDMNSEKTDSSMEDV